MARTLSSLDVPPEIIGKMVQTGPGQVAWLTASDLSSMRVTIVEESADRSAPAPSETSDPSVTQRLPMDMKRYCRENFGSVSRAVALDKRDASSWRCKIGSGLVGISLLKLCRQQYGLDYVYTLGDRHDASSWSCLLKTAE
jgi:hypothetical protein